MNSFEYELYARYLSVCRMACSNGAVLHGVASFAGFRGEPLDTLRGSGRCQEMLGASGDGAGGSVGQTGVGSGGSCGFCAGWSSDVFYNIPGFCSSTETGAKALGDQGDGENERRYPPRGLKGGGIGSSGVFVSADESSGRPQELVGDRGTCDEKVAKVDPELVLSDSGVVGSGGVNVERNRQWRREKKEKKHRRKSGGRQRFGSLASDVPEWRRKSVVQANSVDDELVLSSRKKWIAQNELATVKAQREVAVLAANDVDAEVKRYRTKVCAATEKNMVSIEKVHESLRSSGNVSEDDESRVNTVLSSAVHGSGSISPNSSVSEAEVRKLQKDFVDVQASLRESEARISAMVGSIEKLGLDVDLLDVYQKRDWTIDSTGHVPKENIEKLDKLYPNGYTSTNEVRLENGKRTIAVWG